MVSAFLNIGVAHGDAFYVALLLALPDLGYITIKLDLVHGFRICCGGVLLLGVKSAAGWLLVVGDFQKM
jgi:hypothetical protein